MLLEEESKFNTTHYSCLLIWAGLPPLSLQSLAADQSCEKKAWCSLSCVFQPCSGSDDGSWRALSKSHAHLHIICSDVLKLDKMYSSNKGNLGMNKSILVYRHIVQNLNRFKYFLLQSTDSVPPGFEPISLLEALNGLRSVSPAIPSAPLYDEINFSGGLGGDSRQLSSPEHLSDGSLQKGKVSKSPDR